MKTATCILVLALAVMPAQVMAASTWGPSLSLSYARSCHNDVDGMIGKASVPIWEVKLPMPDTKLSFQADFLAIPDGGTVGAGVGGSVTVKTSLMGINFGIGYIPRGFGWSWNVSLLQIKV
jgi:hypothetical protein